MVRRLDAFPAGELKPAPGGLFSAATVIEHDANDLDWGNKSYTFDSIGCPVRVVDVDVCATGARVVVADNQKTVEHDYFPFGILTEYKCASIGYSVAEREKIVRAQMEIATQKAVEHELWTGVIGRFGGRTNTQYLNDGSATSVTPTGPVKPVVAIALLEQALANCGLGAQGVIHLTRAAGFLGTGNGALTATDDHGLETLLGTPVAAGVGYRPDVSYPAAAITPGDASTLPAPTTMATGTPSTVYGFATGPVVIHLGPVSLFDPYLDRSTNELTITAARPAAVYWDSCCVGVATIDLGLPTPS